MKEFILDVTKLIVGSSSILYGIVGVMLWKTSIRYGQLANRILSVFFLVIAYNSSTFLLITTGYIRFVPFLYKVAFPLNYLPYPLIYLYMRGLTENEQRMRRSDLLHFLPFLITLIDYLPFFAMPLDAKRELVNTLIEHDSIRFFAHESLLPVQVHFLARFVLGGFYCFLILKILWSGKNVYLENRKNRVFGKHFSDIQTWLTTLGLLMLALFIFFTVSAGLIEIEGSYAWKTIGTAVGMVFTSLSILLIVIYIFRHPNILYGTPQLELPESVLPEEVNEGNKEDPKGKKRIEEEFDWVSFHTRVKQEKLFTKAGLTVNEMAAHHALSPRNLSFLIHYYTSDNFQQYINGLRIDYVLDQFEQHVQLEKTIESIGNDAGFGSKSAFFYTFKKFKGVTPGEYIQRGRN